jgi:hypothetical protein
MTLIALSPEELHAIATQLRSGMIHADILAKQLDELVAHARPAVDRDKYTRAIAELRRQPCRGCKPLGQWPAFKDESRVAVCERCAIVSEAKT